MPSEKRIADREKSAVTSLLLTGPDVTPTAPIDTIGLKTES
jgi:hypothetical protein